MLLFFSQSCEKKKQKNPKKKSDVTEINRFLAIGHKHFENEEFDSSYYYYNKAKYAAEIKKDTSRIIHSIAWLAEIQRFLTDYSNSEATAVEALPFLENNEKYPNGRWNIYNTLGNNYLYTYDNKNALYYFNKALNLKTDPIEKANMKNNIAFVYMEQNKHQDAIQILSPLILKKEVLDDAEAYSRILDNLGYCYYKTGNPKSLYYLNQSKKIKIQKNDDRGLIGSYYYLSQYYKKTNPKLATEYAQLSYQKATKVNAINDRLECLELLIQNSTGNKSKEFATLYLKVNDSINKVRIKAKNQFAKIRYDSTREKDENVKLKAQTVLQQEQQHNSNLLLYFVVGIIILISILISNFLVAKNKREKIKSSYNTEIRIAKKLHDELANDVFQTMAFAETHDLSTTQNKEILLNNLETIYSRTRNISKENSTIEAGPMFLSSLKEMMSGFNNVEVNILTNGIDTINWTTLENNKKITVYRVLQELLVNMKKHSQSSLVVISFKKNEGKLQIEYSDNGVGATSEKLTSKNGLQNVENRIKSIKGTITFYTKSNKGFKVSFMFPI
ncbi:tetratricopeptide repeat-containing sensor histidine kinase [Flavobacterium sp. LB1P71]|uniref:tetratricopeptide repeat-containing sensor histidine kinase n=1 Tax=Flavobacterium sp. LB1P71 TaxID=3401716 RepID=UPI003AAF0C65